MNPGLRRDDGVKVARLHAVDKIKRCRSPRNEDVIEAAKNLAMLDIALFKAELHCGI